MTVGPHGTAAYGIVGVPMELDPHNQVVPNDFATRVQFESLVMPTDDGGLVPWLAESWRAVDQSTWEFRLRDDVRFGSGRPLTAEAVKWSFDRLLANPRLLAAARTPTYESSEVVDRSTIRFHTIGPDVIWPRRVLQVVIVDPDELSSSEIVPDPGPDAGTGLFRIAAFTPGESVVHEHAGSTWRGSASLAGLRTVGHDPASLLAGLLDGTIDFGYLSAAAVEQAVDAGLLLQRVLQANVHMIRFRSTGPPFDDIRFRRAISLAIPRSSIVAERYLGEGRAPNQVVGEECFGHVPALPDIPVDPQQARELAAEVGFDGTLSFDILANSAVLRPWGEAAIEALNATGIRTEPNFVDLPTYLGKLAKNVPPRSELIGAGNQYGPGLDAEFSLNKFSDRLPEEQVEYSNPDFQVPYDRSQVEFDPARRLALLQQATRVLLDDVGCVPMYQPAISWLVNPRLEGLSMSTAGVGWVDWRDVGVRQ